MQPMFMNVEPQTHIVADKKPKMMSKSSTMQWLKEISTSEKCKTFCMSHLLNLVRAKDFKFSLRPTSPYGSQHLIMHCSGVGLKNYSSQDSAIVFERKVAVSSEFLELPFGKDLANRIIELHNKYLNGMELCIQTWLRIGFPYSKELSSFVENMHLKFEADSKNEILIEYGCGPGSFMHVLSNNAKLMPTIESKDYPFHFLANPMWNSCLLRRSAEDQTNVITEAPSQVYAYFLWGAQQYPKWQYVITKKFWALSSLLLPMGGQDVRARINAYLLLATLDQPIVEVLKESKKRSLPAAWPRSTKRAKSYFLVAN